MSNERRLPRPPRRRPHVYAYIAALAACTCSLPARADDAIDAWVRWALTPRVWRGPIVPAPEPEPRPHQLGVRIDSLALPLSVHADPKRSAAGARAALIALEAAYLAYLRAGWPLPAADGGRGATLGFDLYLVPGSEPTATGACDGALSPSDFDAAQSFARARAGLPADELEPCLLSAFARAALYSFEPAEAPSSRNASAEFLVWLLNGTPGCDASFAAGQAAPEHSLLGSDLAAAGSGGLLLALLGERHDGGSGTFARALWELARQRSQGLLPLDQLRASPSVWEVLARALEQSGDDWSDALVEFAVARFFAGEPSRRAAASYQVLRGLPAEARVPLLGELSARELPRRVRTAADGGIEPLGSAYLRVRIGPDAGCAAGSCELRIWLRGELGPRWSLTALRLGADGRELGRTSAPARELPQSYLPLALSPDTAEIVAVVANLPRRLPDPAHDALTPHGVELALELVGSAN